MARQGRSTSTNGPSPPNSGERVYTFPYEYLPSTPRQHIKLWEQAADAYMASDYVLSNTVAVKLLTKPGLSAQMEGGCRMLIATSNQGQAHSLFHARKAIDLYQREFDLAETSEKRREAMYFLQVAQYVHCDLSHGP